MSRISFGIDASSTSITLVAYEYDSNKIIARHQVGMDELADSVGVKTEEGMISGPDNYYAVPAKVLAAGAEKIMRMAAEDSSFKNEDVLAASFSVQGHLTAYMRDEIVGVLMDLDKNVSLEQQVSSFFTCDCPTWRNESTRKETARLNEKIRELGLNVVTVAERYPAPQIMQRVGTNAYDEADLIMCGNALFPFFLTGEPSFSGPGDAAASGFVDLEKLVLDKKAMELIAPDLHQKVMQVTPSGTLIGEVSDFFKAMGFKNLKIYTSDQDNIKSGAYLNFKPDIAQVSLGTSYTVSVISKKTIPGFEGNFGSNNPTYPYLLLLCKINGSGSIAKVLKMHELNEKDFEKVSEALKETQYGNSGSMALPWFEPEIIPYAPDAKDIIRNGYIPAFDVDMRAVIEGNAASMKILADNYFKDIVGELKGISFAGGTANNPDILQVWVDMFGVNGYCMHKAEDAAAIGAALTAITDYFNDSGYETPLEIILARFLQSKENKPEVIEPNKIAAQHYRKEFIPAYQQFEAQHSRQR